MFINATENVSRWAENVSVICANASESVSTARSRRTKSATGSDSGGLDNG